jgi:processing peptidase subunit alpha
MHNEEKMKLDPLEDPQPLILSTAYGHETLGMPLTGYKSNIDNLNDKIFNDFFQEHAVPSKIIYCASGIRNHNEFVEQVKKITHRIPPSANIPNQRVKSKYKGGEMRVFYSIPSVSLSLCFESVPWSHPDMPLFGVLNGLLGSAKGFSMGGPGKGMYSRATQDIFHRYPFIEGVNTINVNFTDSGLFGLTIRGASSNAKELSQILGSALSDLKRDVTDEELQRAKNIFKINILMAMETQDNRLEEVVKNVTLPLIS